MREMPLLLPDGSLDDCVIGIVQSHMMFPDDQASIEDDIGAYRMRSQTGFRKSQLGRQMDANFRNAELGGFYADGLIYKLLVFAEHRPDLKVGVNKSIFSLTLEGQAFGKPIEKNKNTVRKYWTEYKNCAHLWAAHSHVYMTTGKKLPLDYIRVLTVAERLVEIASPLIDDWSPWRVPEQFPFEDYTVRIPEPDAEDIARIKRYRAS